ncbi:MAG: MBL fold metallo-hydrolase, partial [Proteobacteria bacterium]|nr:MBL fold metallo-hydrolase [Pseudomonadota bacterium]
LVDPGPRATVPTLLAALEELGVQRLDAILLTHIHIDHAGGAGLVANRYPEARVYSHPVAIPHLVDPAKLWAGSLKVLGGLAEAYGEIAPIPEAAIDFREAFEVGPLRVRALDTPGHAAHHLSFAVGDVLFAGEVAGVHRALASGTYLRPATPPVFRYDVFCRSIDQVAALEPAHLCFGHYGHTPEARRTLGLARSQIDLWVRVVDRHLTRGAEPLDEAVFQALLEVDPHFALYRELPADVQRRERTFFTNTVAGLRGYLQER